MQAADTTIELPTWANGPDGSGNGGWTAGLLAAHVGDPRGGVRVDLRSPPPLGRPLTVELDGSTSGSDRAVLLRDHAAEGEPTLVATARAETVELGLPDAVRATSVAAAREATTRFPYRDAHPFPSCLVCGVARSGDVPSFCIHCGPTNALRAPDVSGVEHPVFAGTWTPASAFADPDAPSHASTTAMWAALDCPSAAPFANPTSAAVLASFAVRLQGRAAIGEEHVLAAWRTHVDGRKLRSTSALLTADGAVLGVAQALWIELRPT